MALEDVLHPPKREALDCLFAGLAVIGYLLQDQAPQLRRLALSLKEVGLVRVCSFDNIRIVVLGCASVCLLGFGSRRGSHG
jgi:hypothetical protein